MLRIGHSVTRPSTRPGDEPITMDIPEELESVPGIVQIPHEVDFYSREYPLEHQQTMFTADREWAWGVLTKEANEERITHERLNKPIVNAARNTGEIEPTVEPVPGKDITQEIKAKAFELGFGDVGFTKYDMRYVFKTKRNWVKFPHAICLAYEQDYELTQMAPSPGGRGTTPQYLQEDGSRGP